MTEPYVAGCAVRCDSVRDGLLILIINKTDPVDNEEYNIIQLIIAKEHSEDIEQTLIDVEEVFREEPIHKALFKMYVETNGVNEMIWESDEDSDYVQVQINVDISDSTDQFTFFYALADEKI